MRQHIYQHAFQNKTIKKPKFENIFNKICKWPLNF